MWRNRNRSFLPVLIQTIQSANFGGPVSCLLTTIGKRLIKVKQIAIRVTVSILLVRNIDYLYEKDAC